MIPIFKKIIHLGKIPIITLRNHIRYLSLRKSLRIQQNNLQSLDIQKIRSQTLSFVESMRITTDPYGQYRYHPDGREPLLYASVYAVLTRHLYGDLDSLPETKKEEWASYIQSFQADDGLFYDPLIQNEFSSSIDWWGNRHLTLHALMALTALDWIAEREIRVIEPFKDPHHIERWLSTRRWNDDPASVSNEIQNYVTMLQYARDFQRQRWADDAVQYFFNWLDRYQDPATGLWGSRFDSPYLLSQGVQTGYHLWLLYFYDRRTIQHQDAIIKSVLKTQNRLGGYGVLSNSSACEDIDSIDPLARFHLVSDREKKIIENSLKTALPWIFVNYNPDGGYVFRRHERFMYGHELMKSREDESAMFPTWFRSLSLAYIGNVLPDSPVGCFSWRFLDCPGHQFWNI